jgi:hypothetical protein
MSEEQQPLSVGKLIDALEGVQLSNIPSSNALMIQLLNTYLQAGVLKPDVPLQDNICALSGVLKTVTSRMEVPQEVINGVYNSMNAMEMEKKVAAAPSSVSQAAAPPQSETVALLSPNSAVPNRSLFPATYPIQSSFQSPFQYQPPVYPPPQQHQMLAGPPVFPLQQHQMLAGPPVFPPQQHQLLPGLPIPMQHQQPYPGHYPYGYSSGGPGSYHCSPYSVQAPYIYPQQQVPTHFLPAPVPPAASLPPRLAPPPSPVTVHPAAASSPAAPPHHQLFGLHHQQQLHQPHRQQQQQQQQQHHPFQPHRWPVEHLLYLQKIRTRGSYFVNT